MSFFYNVYGDLMKIYLDYVFLLNFAFDFLLLLAVSMILKRNIKIKKILYGALIGGISIFALFIKLNTIQLFLFKVIISILMTLITFSYKNIGYTIKNISYLYMVSVLLGGALYAINIQFSYANEGFIFYHKNFSVNVIILLITSPIILYIYIKQARALKVNYSKYHQVDIVYHDQKIKLNAFLDTGNQLVDPVTKIPIIVVKEKTIRPSENYLLIPYTTISGVSMMQCVKPDLVEIDGKKIQKKILLGVAKNLNMEGIECILNPLLMEEIE